MKRILNITAAFAAGALAMYYLDSTMGQRRRARARDVVFGVSHRAAAFVEGAMTTGSHDGVASSHPQSDAQLRERVRARMGHLVSHPRAIEVSVEQGVVRLSGQVLVKELDGLLSQLTEIPGVRKVYNALSVLNDPSGFGEVQSAGEPAEVGPAELGSPPR